MGVGDVDWFLPGCWGVLARDRFYGEGGITAGHVNKGTPVALTTLQSIDAEIRQLEAQKKLVEKRDAEVPKALAVLQKFAKVLTPAQRRQVGKIIGAAIQDAPIATRRARGSGKVRKLGKVAPKYQLPTGETWTGRGLTPKAFSSWLGSSEGKAWGKANPDGKFPLAGGSAKAVSKKATKKVVKKSVKKASKKRAAKKG